MYFGTLEIDSIENGMALLKNGEKIAVTDKNKNLFTEAPIDGSELQNKWVQMVANEILAVLPKDLASESITGKLVDILVEHNVRLVDISKVWDTIFSFLLNIKGELDATIEVKNNETIVNALGKEKLDSVSKIFGAKDNAPSNTIRNIRISDIF
jgi:hypothetical protein